MTDYRHMLMV